MTARLNALQMTAAAILLGSIFNGGAARAGTDPSLAQVFNAVCLQPADAEARKAAAYAQGLRTPPESFKDKRLGGKNATVELNVWKAVEERMLLVYTLIEPMPGYDNLTALTCMAVLSPGGPDALADVSETLGVSFVADDKGAESGAFETTSDGRKPLDMNDDAAMGAAMQSGRLNLISLSRSNRKNDTDAIQLLRTQAP